MVNYRALYENGVEEQLEWNMNFLALFLFIMLIACRWMNDLRLEVEGFRP
jgi:hypothetical protein